MKKYPLKNAMIHQIVCPAARAWLKRRADRHKLLDPKPVSDRSYFTWLRQRTAPHHCALKQPCWNHERGEYKVDAQGNFILEPRPINTNDKILSVLTQRKGFLYKLRNADYHDHMEGTDTYYFQGEGRTDRPETIVMIDIDVQKAGSSARREVRSPLPTISVKPSPTYIANFPPMRRAYMVISSYKSSASWPVMSTASCALSRHGSSWKPGESALTSRTWS